MLSIKFDVTVGFRTDALLTLIYLRDGRRYRSEAWSYKVNDGNYFNDKYAMNLTETTHNFELQLRDTDVPLYDESFIEFGYGGSRQMWVGPGVVKTIPLNQIINSDR